MRWEVSVSNQYSFPSSVNSSINRIRSKTFILFHSAKNSFFIGHWKWIELNRHRFLTESYFGQWTWTALLSQARLHHHIYIIKMRSHIITVHRLMFDPSTIKIPNYYVFFPINRNDYLSSSIIKPRLLFTLFENYSNYCGLKANYNSNRLRAIEFKKNVE